MQSLTHFVPIAWAMLGIIGAIGILALVSPARFSSLTKGSNHWVDTDKIFATLDTRVDVDKYLLPFSRPLGAAVLVAVGVIAFLLASY